MTCSICFGRVEWQGPATNLTHTLCIDCGCTNCEFPDCRPDNTGIDDGPYLPGHAPRKKPTPKSPEELKEIRAKAWATRRAKTVVRFELVDLNDHVQQLKWETMDVLDALARGGS